MEVLSSAIIATMTPNVGKRVTDPGAELKLLWGVVWNNDNHSRCGNTTVETTRLGLTMVISFKIEFFFSGLSNYFQRLATYRKNKSSLTWK